MLIFPIHELMDEQKCYDYLLQVLHPEGLKCPRGHTLPADQQPHDRHRAPIMDYRCRECGAVFNLFTDTIWSGSRYSCVQIILILRGIAQGVPTEHLASELGIDRSHLLERRHEIQQLIEQGLSPLTPIRRRHRSR
jgi:transposase-like protein